MQNALRGICDGWNAAHAGKLDEEDSDWPSVIRGVDGQQRSRHENQVKRLDHRIMSVSQPVMRSIVRGWAMLEF